MIIELLKQKKETYIQDMSLRELKDKIGTNHRTMKTQVEELEYLGIIRIDRLPWSPRMNKPHTLVTLKEE